MVRPTALILLPLDHTTMVDIQIRPPGIKIQIIEFQRPVHPMLAAGWGGSVVKASRVARSESLAVNTTNADNRNTKNEMVQIAEDQRLF